MSFFAKARAGRTVFKRTRKIGDLPEYILYAGIGSNVGGHMQRKVLDPKSEERELSDKVIESNYRTTTGAQAKALIGKHWPDTQVGKVSKTS